MSLRRPGLVGDGWTIARPSPRPRVAAQGVRRPRSARRRRFAELAVGGDAVAVERREEARGDCPHDQRFASFSWPRSRRPPGLRAIGSLRTGTIRRTRPRAPRGVDAPVRLALEHDHEVRRALPAGASRARPRSRSPALERHPAVVEGLHRRVGRRGELAGIGAAASTARSSRRRRLGTESQKRPVPSAAAPAARPRRPRATGGSVEMRSSTPPFWLSLQLELGEPSLRGSGARGRRARARARGS